MHFVSDTADLFIADKSVVEARPPARPQRRELGRLIIRQPLVHFLLAGVLLFCAASIAEKVRDSAPTSIRVGAPEIQRLRDVWTRQYGRAPDAAQMRNLVDEHIREEIYYREALASGLDKDDSIVRRRLIEKMEFLSQEVAGGEPSELELQRYFEQNREKFQIPAQLAFSHIFFSTSRRGRSAEKDARQALQLLQRTTYAAPQASIGDPFMLQSEYPLQTQEEIKSLFGEQFAADLFKATPGEWGGPIRSTYGFHLVRISQFTFAHLPQLSEVRNEVVLHFKNDRLQASSDAYYRRLRAKYRVAIDDAELSVQPAESSPAAGVRQPQTMADED